MDNESSRERMDLSSSTTELRGPTTGLGGSPGEPQPRPREQTRPWALILAALALILVSLVALVALVVFRDVFENASDVTTVLSSLFTIVGTVVGTYFGIKVSGDTTDKTQGAIERANETANRALAQLPPAVGKEMMDER